MTRRPNFRLQEFVNLLFVYTPFMCEGFVIGSGFVITTSLRKRYLVAFTDLYSCFKVYVFVCASFTIAHSSLNDLK